MPTGSGVGSSAFRRERSELTPAKEKRRINAELQTGDAGSGVGSSAFRRERGELTPAKARGMRGVTS